MKHLTKARRLMRLVALAGAMALGLSAWAGFDKTNPVTGVDDTYDYKYVGSGSWTVKDWQDSSGPDGNPSAVPQASGSNLWAPLLIDGKYSVEAPAHVEGWSFRIGLFGGATLTVPYIRYWNGTAFAVVDEGSKLTIKSINTDDNWNATVNYYVAAQGGITYECAFNPTTTAAAIYNYNLKGSGSVVYEQAVTSGSHVIKTADVTLTGTSQVAHKTLVSFDSTSTATFTADAAVKVYGPDGSTLATTKYPITVNTTGETTLTTANAVGTVELVQTTTGIDLYYVDGDAQSVPVKTYLPSISVNFTSGTALSYRGDVGVGDYAVPGTSWNNLIGNNGTLSSVTQVDSSGEANSVAGVEVAISGTRGYYYNNGVSAASDLRQGYIDDNAANASPQFVVSGIPYYSYKTILYFSSDNNDTKFGYVTVNGANYKGDLENTATVAAEAGDIWGAASLSAYTEGGNYLVIPTQVNKDGTLTVVSHRLTGCRAGLAAVQIIEVKKQAGEGELVIDLKGDTTYTVGEDADYTTVYVTGTGTLTLDGEGAITAQTLNVGPVATVNMTGSALAATAVTGNGTVVYNGEQPSTALGFDDSASWFGTVWVKNVGDASRGEATGSKVTTRLGSDTTDATSNELNKWGNANSFVKFTNVRAFMAKADVPWTLVLEDDDTNYAWYNNEGWTARSITIAGLKGDGTFWDINDGGCRPYLNFGDASQFTGTIKALGKQVFLNDTTNTGDATSGLAGRITVPANQTLTVASGKTWHTRNGLVVNGTLNVNGTLASDSITAAVSGSGTVVFTGSAPSPTGDAWWKNSAWAGTVEINGYTSLAGNEFNNYGNAGSTLRLRNCRGWLKANYTCVPALEIEGVFTWNDGSSGLGNTFKVGTLKGSGTISIPTGGAGTAVWQITGDWSGFTGAVVGNNTDGKRVLVFGSTLPSTVEAGEIYVSQGATLNLGNASAAWWTLGKGFVVDGTVVAPNRDKWGGGTAMTLGDTGVLELTSSGNTEDYKNYSGVTGTGTIKYSSTAGWRLFPDTSAKMPATTLTIQTELVDSLIIACTNETVIGNLAGSKNIRSDWADNGENGRTLTVTQSKNTEWQGKFVSNRITQFNVNPGASATGTLTLSGAQTFTIPASISGSVNLTGTWVGDTTVSGVFGGTGTLTGGLTFAEGATFKVFATDGNAATDTDGLAVSGAIAYPETGAVTVALDAIPLVDTVLLSATGLDEEKFELATGTAGSLKVENDTLVYATPFVTVTIPEVDNATATVTVSGETLSPITAGGNLYAVTQGATVTVTYAPVDGYAISGTTVYTLDTSTATTFEIIDTATVKYVAQIRTGATSYEYHTTLAAALASENVAYGITLLDDISEASITVSSTAMILGSYTINSAVTVANGGLLALYGPTLAGTLTIANGGTYMTGGGNLGSLVAEDGATITLMTLSETTAPLAIARLTVNGTLTVNTTYSAAVEDTTYKAISYATAAAVFAQGATIAGAGDWEVSTETDGDNTIICLTQPIEGIDPTVEGSTQTVTPTAEEIAAAGGAEEAAIALAAVTVPAAASGYVDAAAYKGYFKFAAKAGESGAYTVSIAGFADAVKADVESSVLAQVLAAEASAKEVTVAVKPGLCYGFAVGSTLGAVSAEPATTLATGTTATVQKPAGDTGFVKVRITTKE